MGKLLRLFRISTSHRDGSLCLCSLRHENERRVSSSERSILRSSVKEDWRQSCVCFSAAAVSRFVDVLICSTGRFSSASWLFRIYNMGPYLPQRLHLPFHLMGLSIWLILLRRNRWPRPAMCFVGISTRVATVRLHRASHRLSFVMPAMRLRNARFRLRSS